MKNIHPSLQVDKMKKKRYNLLCKDPTFRSEVSWFKILLIGFTGHIKIKVPKFYGPRESLVAYREHAKDLIKIYAPRITRPCGHKGRGEHCQACSDNLWTTVNDYIEGYKKRKGYTDDQWEEKRAAWRAKNPEKVKEFAMSPYMKSLLSKPEDLCAEK